MLYPCPYPTITALNEKVDGFLLPVPNICRKCAGGFCLSLFKAAIGEPSHLVCPKGVSCYAVSIGHEPVVVCGILDLAVNRACPASVKKMLRSHKVPPGAVPAWAQSVAHWVGAHAEEKLREAAAETTGMLHDVKTMASAMMRTCESLMRSLPGETDAEKYEQADPYQIKLIKAGRLMASCFRMMDIYVNPRSVSYGQCREVPIYKLIHMLVRIFEEKAHARGVSIDIAGPSFNVVPVYDSFDVLPMVLLDNAVKYCEPSHSVHVLVQDEGAGVSVRVDSYGPPVPRDEWTKIFGKGYRTERAKEAESGGSGLGLYIARIVAQAHNTDVEYAAVQLERGNMNRFSFFLAP